MQIIIVGCGKVGYTLVEQLGGEDHNIVVIDESEEKVQAITNDLDAMGIVGNGVSFQTLERLLSRLAFDTFFFGTAMFSTSLHLIRESK